MKPVGPGGGVTRTMAQQSSGNGLQNSKWGSYLNDDGKTQGKDFFGNDQRRNYGYYGAYTGNAKNRPDNAAALWRRAIRLARKNTKSQNR